MINIPELHGVKRNRGGGNFFVSVGVHECQAKNAAIVRGSKDLCVVLREKGESGRGREGKREGGKEGGREKKVERVEGEDS